MASAIVVVSSSVSSRLPHHTGERESHEAVYSSRTSIRRGAGVGMVSIVLLICATPGERRLNVVRGTRRPTVVLLLFELRPLDAHVLDLPAGEEPDEQYEGHVDGGVD